MSFLSRIGFIETEEQERTRLAQAPEGSLNHYLSTLPVTIEEWPKDLLVELPWEPPRTNQSYRVVVVPMEFRKEALPDGVEEEPVPRKLHSGSWMCAVVFSTHPSYPVGGFRIDVPATEIARGRKVDLATALAPLAATASRPAPDPATQPPKPCRVQRDQGTQHGTVEPETDGGTELDASDRSAVRALAASAGLTPASTADNGAPLS